MQAKYDKIGINYNATRKADPFLTQQLIAYLKPIENGLYLDIGCGTGNYTCQLQKKELRMIGIDPSEKMLEVARKKNTKVSWKKACAENIELADNYVDGVIGSLTIHHWTNLQKGFSEIHRILKPNGRFVIFTSTPTQMKGYWLNHYFPKMLLDSIAQMPRLETIRKATQENKLTITGIDKYFIKPNLEDQFLYCGKQNPALYFDEQIRHGISSFSSLANRAEVKQGLLDLEQDINSGKINEIVKSYENEAGDYLYVYGKK